MGHLSQRNLGPRQQLMARGPQGLREGRAHPASICITLCAIVNYVHHAPGTIGVAAADWRVTRAGLVVGTPSDMYARCGQAGIGA